MARLHALVVAAVVATATMAHAEVDLPETRATIDVGPEWKPVTRPGLVAGYTTSNGLVLAITRAQVPNGDAWRSKKRDAYVDEIVRGIAGAIDGYKQTQKKLGEVNGVPVLDVEAKGKAGIYVIRVILFRTYALALAIEGPAHQLANARATAATFVPPKVPASQMP